jgi:hypothetical protein
MKNSRTLTLQQLKDADACNAQVVLFRQTFGVSVEVTGELAEQYAQQFDFGFAAQRFLSAPALAEYKKVAAPARAEYDKARAPALAEYKKVAAPARAEYDKARAPALAEYKKVAAAARAEYDKVIAPAYAEYHKVRAQAFANSYINDRH